MADSQQPTIPPSDTGAPGPAMDPAQQALVQALRASFSVLRVLMIVLVGLYLLSGIVRIEPDEQGLIARLGALRTHEVDGRGSPTFRPGWHWALPDPFDEKYIVSSKVLEMKNTQFMFEHEDAAASTNLAEILVRKSSLEPGIDGAMLTGDRNLSHGRWEVQYQITDAARFVQNIGENPAKFEPLLSRLLETAVVTEVAGRTIEEVTRKALNSVRNGVWKRLQKSLNELDTGVQIVEVVAYTIEPGAVRSAFLDVTRAENEKLATRDRAEEQATEILNQAAGARDRRERLMALIDQYGDAQLRDASSDELAALREGIDVALIEAEQQGAGQVAVTLREARAMANQISEQVQREYEEFARYLELRAAQPRIAVLGLWVDMRKSVLGTLKNEIFFVPHSDEIEILINRDPMRRIRLSEEAALERQPGRRELKPGEQPPSRRGPGGG